MVFGETKEDEMMKKLLIIALTALVALTVSCNKDITPEQDNNQDNTVSIVKSFKVVMPETRAYLGDNDATGKKLVKFSDGDEITIFANTSGNAYIGSYDAAANEFITEITQEADTNENVFYAVYPSTYISSDNNSYSHANAWKFKKTNNIWIESQKVLNTTFSAVKDGIDDNYAVMTAKTDADGKLSFVYGCAFLKVKVDADNITSIQFTTTKERISGRPQYGEDCEIVTVQSGVNTITVTGSFENGGSYYIPIIPRCYDSNQKLQNVGDFTVTYTNTDGKSNSLTTSALNNVSFLPGIIYNIGTPGISFEPSLTLLKSSINNIPSEGGNDLIISNAYKIENSSDSNVSVTCDGIVVTSASISGGSVTYSVSQNTGVARDGWIGLCLDEGEVLQITASQLGTEDTEDYIWDFSSSEWQAALETQASNAKSNKDATNWSVSYDGLTFTATSKARWEPTGFIQPGGKSNLNNNDRVFRFTVLNAGVVSVTSSNTGDSEATDGRAIGLMDSTNVEKTQTCINPASSPEVYNFNVEAGDVYVYSVTNAHRYYKIEFHSN